MASVTPSTSSRSEKNPVTPTTQGQDPIDDMNVDESDSDDEVTKKDLNKLRKRNDRLGAELNKLAEISAKKDLEKDDKINKLIEQVTQLLTQNDRLSGDLIRQEALYRDHITHLDSLTANGKDAGEILRPKQPDPFDGAATGLQGFLTQVRAFQSYYPTQFTREEAKVRHATGLLKDKALRWFEPVIRDYLNNPYHAQKDKTRAIYASYEAFERELRDAFGLIDEKRAAEMRLQKLTQKASASSYAAEFRNSTSYLNWGEEAYIAAYYRKLKSEVKDAIVRRKPTTFNTLVTLSVEIDNQQFERRQEKKTEKSGGTPYTPS
ncbi:gag polyprotein [Ilyonectria robusta]